MREAPTSLRRLAPPLRRRDISDTAFDTVMGLLRDVRAEAQNIRKSIGELQQKKDLANRDVRDHEIKTDFKTLVDVFSYSGDKIQERLKNLREFLSASADPYNRWGDLVTEVEDDWQSIQHLKEGNLTEVSDILDFVSKVDGLLHDMILLCARSTIPGRVEEHLASLRVGQTLDFNENFKDELDSAQDRQDVLNFIATHPTVIDGMVDTSSGLIYKSGPLWRQIVSYLLIIGIIVGGGVSIFLFSYLGTSYSLTNWPVGTARIGELVVAYFFVFLGSLVHVGVESLKQSRAAKNNVPTALGNLFLWFHVKETSEILGILTLWVGFWGLVFTVQKIDWQVAFFVGFGIDSFAELFLQRFTTYASTKTGEMTKQLGLDSGSQ